MKFLFASDSFKGTLSSEKIIELLTESAEKIFPGCETAGVPVADGGMLFEFRNRTERVLCGWNEEFRSAGKRLLVNNNSRRSIRYIAGIYHCRIQMAQL